MSTSMQDSTTEGVSEVTVSPRSLDLRFADEMICWEDNPDLNVVLKKARATEHTKLPSGHGGYVLVGLNTDGDDLHEVVTEDGYEPLNEDGIGRRRDHVEVIDEAIRVLALARDGILKAQASGGAR